MTEKPEVRHNIAANRFEIEVENNLAVLDYARRGETIAFTHTGVPTKLEGRGLGSQLVRAGLDYARENSLRVASLCWFVTGYIERHQEYKTLMKG